ncbi:MAG: alginate export family protein [Sphingobium sp.]
MRAPLILLATGAALAAAPASAQTITLKPLIDARLRYEGVDQDGLSRNADAVTLRARVGVEAKSGPWSALAESEALLAIGPHYNSAVNGRTLYPVVADPQNIELNRIQIQYRGLPKTVVTVGRQRINLDDQRFVGSVAWRQNEQTFDAVRVESAAFGPISVDLTYSWSDRTIYGIDSPIQHIDGDNILAGVGLKLGPVMAKGFAYLVDQDQATRRQFSSQTYGLRAVGAFPLAAGVKLGVIGSYAHQSDYASNPNRYSADYYLGEATLGVKGFALTGGYEVLGASNGTANSSFQTPLATLHKFQGWADKFLTTPANGIRDLYASAGYGVPKSALGPISMLVAWHRFDSDRLSIDYGHEWDAQIGFKPTPHTALLVKYADYQARAFATDTQKLWLQFDYLL